MPVIYPADIINRALNLVGCEITIGDPQDGSRESQIALRQYTQTVWALLRAQDHEFSRKVAKLNLSGNIAPLGWAFEYLCPADYLKVRTVVTPGISIYSPLPSRWDVGTSVVSGSQVTVLWTNIATAQLSYTSNEVIEDYWDPLFTETVVQYLSSSLAPLLSPRDDKGQTKGGQEGYAQASKLMELDVDRDS